LLGEKRYTGKREALTSCEERSKGGILILFRKKILFNP